MNAAKSVWVVTEGQYSEYHVDSIFTTKEKAYGYYNKKKIYDYKINRPYEMPLDKGVIIKKVLATLLDDGSWFFDDNSIGFRKDMYDSKTNYARFIIPFNADEKVMIKIANDRLAFMKARDAGIC